ncbi:MAG: S41 family peptidase [Rhodothermia bacterium]|nr:S41 family peptidase [Rhodothermia bacterium]
MNDLRRTALVFVVASAFGILIGAFWPRDDDFFAIRKSFEIYGGVYEELVGSYVDDIEPERLMRTGINAMLAELDPFTVFFDEADNADMDIITRGSYGGVGLNVGVRNGRITVIAPIEGASGYKQGVRAGDVIVRVERKGTEDLSISDVQTLLRGEPGTTVEIAVEREGTQDPISFTLTREEVKLNNVSFAGTLSGTDVAYIRLDRFAHEASREVRSAIESLSNERELDGLILDLRDNPGGLLDAAVEITEMLVPRGSVVVSTNGRLPETKRVYRSGKEPILDDTPLVILVNELSASASEIVAGAVQDLDRGVVIGNETFGKGLVQVVRGLPYNTSLKITTSRYYTPSGRSIQSANYGFGHAAKDESMPRDAERFSTSNGRQVRGGHGIEPDVTVDDSPSPLERALHRKAAFFLYANHFAATRDSVSLDFVPDDALIDDFESWLASRDFSYETAAEHALDQVIASLTASEIRDADDEVRQLREAMEAEKHAGFARHREKIRERLRSEIVARYHGEQDQIRSSFDYDEYVREALSILADQERYNEILSVQ